MASASGFWVQGLRCRILGLEGRVRDLGFRIQGLGLWVVRCWGLGAFWVLVGS